MIQKYDDDFINKIYQMSQKTHTLAFVMAMVFQLNTRDIKMKRKLTTFSFYWLFTLSHFTLSLKHSYFGSDDFFLLNFWQSFNMI